MDKVSSRHTEKDQEMPVDLRVGTLVPLLSRWLALALGIDGLVECTGIQRVNGTREQNVAVLIAAGAPAVGSAPQSVHSSPRHDDRSAVEATPAKPARPNLHRAGPRRPRARRRRIVTTLFVDGAAISIWLRPGCVDPTALVRWAEEVGGQLLLSPLGRRDERRRAQCLSCDRGAGGLPAPDLPDRAPTAADGLRTVKQVGVDIALAVAAVESQQRDGWARLILAGSRRRLLPVAEGARRAGRRSAVRSKRAAVDEPVSRLLRRGDVRFDRSRAAPDASVRCLNGEADVHVAGVMRRRAR
jgi:hypothetical protein